MSADRKPTPSFAAFWSLQYAAGGLPLTQAISQRIGAVIAWVACRLHLGPTAVTLLGAMTFACGAALFAVASTSFATSIAILLVFQLGYAIDCADGQVARATASTSAFGAWLDLAADYLRNLMLSAAALLCVARDTDLSLIVVAAGTFAYAVGTVIGLHTLTVLRSLGGPRTAAPSSAARFLAGCCLDTVTTLGLLALLRLWPEWLLGYMALVGVASGAIALRQALGRVR